MGIGYTLVVDEADVEDILADLKAMDIAAYEIGYIEDGDNQLCLR